jgi:hypothetical protein
MSTTKTQEQQHPQEKKDQAIVDNLLKGQCSDHNLTELARLIIRYHNFPGARQLQLNLQEILRQWGLTEEELFRKTREIYASKKFNNRNAQREEVEDWS